MGSAKVLPAAAFCLGLLLYSGVSAGTWEAELPGYWCDPYIVWGEHHEFAAIAEGNAYLSAEDEITTFLGQHGGGSTFPADWTGGAGGSQLSQYTSGWYWVPDDPNDEPTTQDVTVECRHWKYDRQRAFLFAYVGTGAGGFSYAFAKSNVYVDPQDEGSTRGAGAEQNGRDGSVEVNLPRIIVELEVEVNATDDEVMVTLENLFVWECNVDENWAGCDIDWETWAIIPQPVEE